MYGNAPLEKTTKNALAVLEAIGKPTVPVFPGAKNPFGRTLHTATDIHGESGIDGTDLLPSPTRKALTHCNAINEMKDALMSCPPNTAWLVTTGTLTNAALMFAIYPEVASHIKGLSIMGGAIGKWIHFGDNGKAVRGQGRQTATKNRKYEELCGVQYLVRSRSVTSIASESSLEAKDSLDTTGRDSPSIRWEGGPRLSSLREGWKARTANAFAANVQRASNVLRVNVCIRV